MMKQTQRKQFMSYFRKRLESLDYCNSAFENNLQEKKQDMVDSVNRGNISRDDPELLAAFSQIDYRILPTFRNSMIVAVCTFLEETLRRIGMLSFSNFDSEANKLSNMSKIRKYLKVYESNMAIVLGPIEDHICTIDDIISLRNAIVHAWGKIDNCTNPDKLREIIARRSWVLKTDDGYIFLDDQAYADAVDPLLRIVEYILDKIPVSD